MPEPLGPRRAVSEPLDLQGDVVECEELAELLGDVPDLDRHQSASSRGLIRVMAMSTSTAVAARTGEIAYAPATSKLW